MKKFEFTLQSVLNLKEQSEKIEKENLAKIMKEIEREREKLENLKKHLQEVTKRAKEEVEEGTLMYKLAETETYIMKIREMIEKQANYILKLEKEAEKIREGLLKVSKEKKALENLKERQFSEYLYLLNLEQTRMIDEHVSYKVAKSY
ncbi:flagellar export protein FliJ [Caldanaerobacter subterraneus KAk]|uniref:flagellar export protein FliJ n=1 Tax=Caldanaerobacter subterraneus TaxID=911092 RepID=UPI0032C01CAE